MRFLLLVVLAVWLFPFTWAQDKDPRKLLDSAYQTLQRSPAEALPYFEAAQRYAPSDTTALQIAFLLNQLGRNRESLQWFRSMEGSRDSAISAKARSAVVLLGLQVCAEQEPWWYRTYVSPYYDTRFRDFVLLGSFHAGHYLGSGRKYSWFGTAAVATDTRSTAGALPEIYADHFFLLGGGLRAEPVPGLTGDVQLGVTADLMRRNGKPVINPDFRLLVSYGNGIYPPFTLTEDVSTPMDLLLDCYTSAGYYTRYDNVIGYLQGRAGVRFLSWGYSTADLYARGDLVWDTRREFYNNLAEISAGLRVIPHQAWGVQVLVEHHVGRYVGPLTGNPSGRSYHSTRMFIILDRFFCW